MEKQAYLEEIYNSAFNDELNKIAEDGPKTYAGTGAKIGLGASIGASALTAPYLYSDARSGLGKKQGLVYTAAALGLANILGSGLGAIGGSMFKRKNRKE